MILFFAALFLTLFGCGEERPKSTTTVGLSVVDLDALGSLSVVEKENFKNICDALKKKNDYFGKFYVNKQFVYSFSHRLVSEREECKRVLKEEEVVFELKDLEQGRYGFLTISGDDSLKEYISLDIPKYAAFCDKWGNGSDDQRYIKLNGSVEIVKLEGDLQGCNVDQKPYEFCIRTSQAIQNLNRYKIISESSWRMNFDSQDTNKIGLVTYSKFSRNPFVLPENCTEQEVNEIYEQTLKEIR